METVPISRQRPPRVLVVEDEPDVAELLRYNLTKEGYAVLHAGDGVKGLRQARDAHPDVILLDLLIPELNGWEVCRRLKQDLPTRAIPVIMLTARGDEGDRLLGFELGVDDYVTKPFSIRELIARLRAVIRRAASTPASRRAERGALRSGDLAIDPRRYEVTVKGRAVAVTRTEFELLATLVREPGRVFEREELLDLVWGRDGFVEPRTVDVHVTRLRHKLLAAKLPALALETVRGVGYRLRDPRDGTSGP